MEINENVLATQSPQVVEKKIANKVIHSIPSKRSSFFIFAFLVRGLVSQFGSTPDGV